jgi:peptide/nickel transport system substrate-binding protein
MSDLNQTSQRLLRSAISRRDVLRGVGAAGAGAAAMALGGGTAAARVPGGADFVARFQAGTPGAGGLLTLLSDQEIAGLSPENSDVTVQFVAVVQLHNALVEIDETLTYQPVLATELPTVSADGKTYTMTLRDDVTFQDGTKLTSADVKYTYEWVKNPDNASINGANFEDVGSVEAPDERTVVVTLAAPNAAFNARVGSQLILPSAYHKQVGQEAYAQKPMGTGAFKVNEFRANEYTLFDAWDGHFRGRPTIDQIRIDVVPEPSVRAEALENGEADNSIWHLTPEDDARLTEDDRFNTYIQLDFAVNHIVLNNTSPILSDKAVRQAMMWAIDRQVIADEIFLGQAELATSSLSPGTGDFYNPNTTQYSFDPDKANALLDGVGWTRSGSDTRKKDGQELAFTCYLKTGDAARRSEAEVVQEYLSDVGIKMDLQEAASTQILDQMPKGEIDAALFNWTYGDGSDPDASSELASNGVNNFSQFRNPQVDELLKQGLAALTREERIPIYQQIQQIVSDEVPFLYMVYLKSATHYTARVKGLPDPATVLSTDDMYRKTYQWSLDPAT